MKRSRSLTLAVSLCAGLILLAAGCGRERAADNRPGLVASPALRPAVAVQDSLFAAPPPAAPAADEMRRYLDISRFLHDPQRRPAVREAYFEAWRAKPGDALLVEVAVLHRPRLGGGVERDSLLAVAAGDDTLSAIHHFVNGRRDWGRRPGARASFGRAAELAAGHDPFLEVWSRLREARTMADDGEVDAAVAQLIGRLRSSWRVGGPALTAMVWQNIYIVSRNSGRLDDALAASQMVEACADVLDDAHLRTGARLSMGRTHLQRGRYALATETLRSCYEVASDSGFVRLQARATGRLAMVAQAVGDLEREIAELRLLHGITQAAADTNGMVRAAVAVASALRRNGDLDGAENWFVRAETADAACRSVDLTAMIVEERAILLNQQGDYAAADSLRNLLAENVDPQRNRASSILLQVHLIRQGLETNRPDLAYRALARARELDPAALPYSTTFDTPLHLALAAAQLHARQGEYLLADAQLAAAEERVTTANRMTAWYVADTRAKVAREAGDRGAAREAFAHCAALADSIGELDLARRSRVRLSAALLADERYAAAESLVADDLRAAEYWTRLNARLVQGMARAGAGRHEGALAAFAAADSVLGAEPPADLAARLDLEWGRSQAALGRHREAYARLEQARGHLDEPARGRTELGDSFNRRIRRDVAEALLGLLHDHRDLAGSAGAVSASREVAAWVRRTPPARARGPRVEYFLGEGRAFAWATAGAPDDVRWVELAPPSELADLVGAVATDLSYPGRAVDDDSLRRLGELLLLPLVGLWPAGSVLEIAPDAALAALPWSALTWPDSGKPALVHGPLVIAAGEPAPVATSRHPEGLLAVGVDGSADPDGPRLAQAEAEARAVAALWTGGDVDLRLGADGSLGDLLAGGLQGHRAIHISSHARVYEGLEGHSAIHVAGNGEVPLTIGQIVEAGTDAELVYLSNCEGARRHRSAGRGVVSFADAFLVAGAGAVVASSVLVDDEAGRVLAETFYRHWLGGKEEAAALRAALLELEGVDPRWAHPFYWGFTNIYTRPVG